MGTARIDPALVRRLHGAAGAAGWQLSVESFAEALKRSANRMFGENATSARAVTRYLESLHLQDLALAARETVSAEDTTSRATTRVALAQVRAAQGRNDEADGLFGEAVEILGQSEQCRILLDILPPYADFLRALERTAEAEALEARLASRVPTAAYSSSRIASSDARSGDSVMTVAGRSNLVNASPSGAARSVPSP